MNEPAERNDVSWAQPYLIGCDRQGRVVWMSAEVRSALSPGEELPAGVARHLRAGAALRMWPVLVLSDTLLIGAQMELPRTAGNARMEDRIVRNLRRLQLAERVLSARIKLRAGGHGRLVRQIELERQRLGRELHSGVGQMLAAIRLQLEVVASQIPNPEETVRRALIGIDRLAADALEQIRGISHRLHPPEWQRLTLESALSQLWDASAIPQRFSAQLALHPLPQEPEHEVKVLFYRAAQEALSNIARHSGASKVAMALEANGNTAILTIHDNGHGFDLAAAASAPANIGAGIGLRTLREEAGDLGAKFEIQSGPQGTTLRVIAQCKRAPGGE